MLSKDNPLNLKNYLKIAARNIWKHKAYSFINVAGLAIGMACCMLILLYVRDELNFDAVHKKADRIFRIVDVRKSPDKGDRHIPQLLAASKIVVDILEQCATIGDLHHALEEGLVTRDRVHAELAKWSLAKSRVALRRRNHHLRFHRHGAAGRRRRSDCL